MVNPVLGSVLPNVVIPVTFKFFPIFTLFSTPIPPSTTREPLSLLSDSVCPDTISGSLILTLASESIIRFPVPALVLIVFEPISTLPRDEIPETFNPSVIDTPYPVVSNFLELS